MEVVAVLWQPTNDVHRWKTVRWLEAAAKLRSVKRLAGCAGYVCRRCQGGSDLYTTLQIP
eukprot:6183889-Pleurochrysis_carterae.AAC.1